MAAASMHINFVMMVLLFPLVRFGSSSINTLRTFHSGVTLFERSSDSVRFVQETMTGIMVD
jgi:hypothetical protein